MCARASGLFCACLLVSCIFNCHCIMKHNVTEDSAEDRHEESTDSNIYVKKLFNKYGNANGILTLSGLECMLESLGLYSTQFPNNPTQCKNISQKTFSKNDSNKTAFVNIAENIVEQPVGQSGSSSNKILQTQKALDDENESIGALKNKTKHVNHLCSIKFCNGNEVLHIPDFKAQFTEELMFRFNITSDNDIISRKNFLHLCPAIIYQIDEIIFQNKLSAEHHDHHDESIYEVWLYAIISVAIISLCGLFSVAIIPVIQRVCYHMLLQFLVGLAVGSLTGDALLHLLPHAFSSDSHMEDEHSAIFILRGFTALIGIYLFYFAERLLNLVASYRKVKQNAKIIEIVPKFSRALTCIDGEQSKVVGEKLSHHKHGSYGYKFDPAFVESLQENESQKDKSEANGDTEPKLNGNGIESNTTEPQMTELEKTNCVDQNGDPSSPMKPLQVDVTYIPSEKQSEPESPTEECHRETVVYSEANDEQSYVVTVTEHHHGHSHEVPKTIASVAYMVVFGDGLHNFCDGLAIGAAFAANISGGLSTAIAVFCHELPHELGDFAILLKAGMTVKQALVYNSISSILCFLGLMIGLSLGNITSASYWIFAGAGGMFLYIALVDMVPELTAASGHGNVFKQLFVQLCGLSIGSTIMFLIAVYEHDLHNLVR